MPIRQPPAGPSDRRRSGYGGDRRRHRLQRGDLGAFTVVARELVGPTTGLELQRRGFNRTLRPEEGPSRRRMIRGTIWSQGRNWGYGSPGEGCFGA